MALADATKEFFKRQTWFRPLRLARLALRARRERPDWSRLLPARARASLAPPENAPRVLIGTSVGLHLAANTADSLFAAALLARGAQVDVLLCDAAVSACMACESNWFPDLDRFVSNGARDLCKSCFAPAERMFAALPVTVRRYSEFLTGEDQDFFRRMIDKGRVFVWCNEAVAYEVVPPIRCQRKFMLKRALLRGAMSLVHPTFGVRHIAKSVVAVPGYAAVLPFALVLGHHRFMTCLVKLFDHLGRLLALVGIKPIAEPYVTE